MKCIVLYESKTGFTAQYATWIAEALQCECLPLSRADEKTIAAYDAIIFGGWIFGNMIMGLTKQKTRFPTPSAVFAVGSTPNKDGIAAEIQKVNNLENTPFFYFEGGFHFEKLGLGKKLLLKMLKNATAKKEVKTAKEEFMVQTLGTSFDHSDKNSIAPLIEYINGLQQKHEN